MKVGLAIDTEAGPALSFQNEFVAKRCQSRHVKRFTLFVVPDVNPDVIEHFASLALKTAQRSGSRRLHVVVSRQSLSPNDLPLL